MVPTFMDIQCSILDVRRYLWLFMEVQCSMLDVQCSMLGFSGVRMGFNGGITLKGGNAPGWTSWSDYSSN